MTDVSNFLELVRLIVNGDRDEVTRRVNARRELASMALPIASKQPRTSEIFFPEIKHYIYGGDTALHMAAAACSLQAAELLMGHGADHGAKNRRGAEPLHYASDASGEGQAELIEYLVHVGANPNASDRSGVAPLHRAIRRRSSAAVKALLEGGARVRERNGSGSTPLHLAVQNTGASGSGSERAHLEQKEIIRLLLVHGADPADRDSNGKTVEQAATSEAIRRLLNQMR